MDSSSEPPAQPPESDERLRVLMALARVVSGESSVGRKRSIGEGSIGQPSAWITGVSAEDDMVLSEMRSLVALLKREYAE